jgi:hypothetical protein
MENILILHQENRRFGSYLALLKLLESEQPIYRPEVYDIILGILAKHQCLQEKYFKLALDYHKHHPCNNSKLFLALHHIVDKKEFPPELRIDGVRGAFLQMLYEIHTFTFGEHYRLSHKIIMDYLKEYRSYDLMNLHHLTLPWSEKQFCEYYRLDSSKEIKLKSSIFDFAKRTQQLTIGFFSNDFYNRPSGQLVFNMFKHLKHMARIILFCHYPIIKDNHYHKFVSTCDKMVELGVELTTMEMAKVIYDHHVDVLVDLKGKMIMNMLDVFKYRPAPVQISWLAYPGSTGLDEMDYIIGDNHVITPDFEQNIPEKVIRFPICYQVNNEEQTMLKYDLAEGEQKIYDDPNKIILANLNFVYKMDDITISIINKILQARPNTIMVFLGTLNPHLKKHFPENRIFFTNYLGKGNHIFRMHRGMDIIIDSVRCNSHTSASDALHAGVPIVTLKGDTYQARVCASLLNAVDQDNLIVSTPDEMVKKSLELIDLGKEKLREMKQKIRAKVFSSSLYNTFIYAEYFYQACYVAKERWLANQLPTSMNLTPVDIYTEKIAPKNFLLTIPLDSILRLKLGDNIITLVYKEGSLFINDQLIIVSISDTHLKLPFFRKEKCYLPMANYTIDLIDCHTAALEVARPFHFGFHPVEYRIGIQEID